MGQQIMPIFHSMQNVFTKAYRAYVKQMERSGVRKYGVRCHWTGFQTVL